MNDHISLMMYYISELHKVAIAQEWVNAAREANRNQYMQLQLDRYQTQLTTKKDKLHDEMFEISRNN